MTIRGAVKAVLLAAAMPCAALAGGAAPAPVVVPAPAAGESADMTQLLDYLRAQNSTGFLVIRNGRTLIEKNWPTPTGEAMFANFVYARGADGAPREDVASQQKSFVSVLVAVAIDKGLIDVTKPVSAYIGTGWSKASAEQEAKIRVIDVLTMSSGLSDGFAYQAPAGAMFHYNTPVYAMTKRIVAAAARQPLETITRDWLTGPAGMADTAWRKRPAALAGVGNDTGLVTTPRDTAKFGAMILHGGVAESGRRIVSASGFRAMFTPSATNPAYGRLWWLNGGAWSVNAVGARKDGPLIAGAPADMVAALGAFDRRLYVVPSRKLVVVRMGATATDRQFDAQLWARLAKVIG